jgi:hypothetical protein
MPFVSENIDFELLPQSLRAAYNDINNMNNFQLQQLIKKHQESTVVQIGENITDATIAILTGQPKNMFVYSCNRKFSNLREIKGKTNFIFYKTIAENPALSKKCDVLLIPNSNLLNQYHANVNKWIILENKTTDLLSLRNFLEKHQEWFIIYHNAEKSNTITIISRVMEDKHVTPIAIHQTPTNAIYSATCANCPFRRFNRCLIGGFYLDKVVKDNQIKWVANSCPIATMPKSKKSFV